MAKRDGKNLEATQPIQDIESIRRQHAELAQILEQHDGGRSFFEGLSRHVRRHLPLYALGAVFALVVVLVPTTNGVGGSTASSLTPGASGTTDTSGAIDTTTGAGSGETVGGTSAIGGGSAPGSTGGAGSSAIDQGSGVLPVTGGPVAQVHIGTGVTRGGFACKPGVRQLKFSAYAYPCVAKFTGNNGGATYRGVDAKTIKIAIRKTSDSGGPSAQTVDAANKAAGRASRTEFLAFVKKYWLPYFNKSFELYGREVVFDEYGSTQSNGVDEAQSKGKDGACADASAIINTKKDFGDVLFATGFGESQPFAQCAKEKGGLFVPLAAAYYPEGAIQDSKHVNMNGVSYRSWAPYVYHIAMECEQISSDVAEYVGKRLLNRNATWAADPLYKSHKRVFGTYVPDNAGYQHCVNLSEDKLKADYGGKIAWRHNYPLDVSRFPDQAAQAVLEFQAHGVTTLINACDTISTELMTTAAAKNGWGPEWFIIGVATQDTNGSARTFDKTAVAGHLFGMSQLGPDALTLGTGAEPAIAFKLANPGVTPPTGVLQAYWPMVHIFNLLQAAGPVLTPLNIQIGASKQPSGGGARGALGTWSLKDDHTEIDDSREIYWDSTVPADKSGDGKVGAYIEANGGKRYGSGAWPAGQPQIQPK